MSSRPARRSERRELDQEDRLGLGGIAGFVEGEDRRTGEILGDLGAQRASQQLLGEARAIAPRRERAPPNDGSARRAGIRLHADDRRGAPGIGVQSGCAGRALVGVSIRADRRGRRAVVEAPRLSRRCRRAHSVAIVPWRKPGAARRRPRGRQRGEARLGEERGSTSSDSVPSRASRTRTQRLGAGQRAVEGTQSRSDRRPSGGRARADREAVLIGPPVRAAPHRPRRRSRLRPPGGRRPSRPRVRFTALEPEGGLLVVESAASFAREAPSGGDATL